jgi:putative SOS response-associated peptidase YedK
MCGRYAFTDIEDVYEARRILEEVAQRLGDEVVASVKTGEVCPTDNAVVVAQRPGGSRAEVMRWGYPIGGGLVINARSETLDEKPAFRRSLGVARCLVPCTGFFEWKAEGKDRKSTRLNSSHT